MKHFSAQVLPVKLPPYAIEIAQKKGAAAMEQIIESERYACVRTGDVEEKM